MVSFALRPVGCQVYHLIFVPLHHCISHQKFHQAHAFHFASAGLFAMCFAGVKGKGLDPDEAIAKQLGLGKASDMSELQEKYKDKMKDRLADVRSEDEFPLTVSANGSHLYQCIMHVMRTNVYTVGIVSS